MTSDPGYRHTSRNMHAKIWQIPNIPKVVNKIKYGTTSVYQLCWLIPAGVVSTCRVLYVNEDFLYVTLET